MAKEDDDQRNTVKADGAEAAKSRRFLNYFVIWEHDKPPVIHEMVRIKRGTPDERNVAFVTDIAIPESVLLKMVTVPGMEKEVMTFCSDIGAEIISTARMRFSFPPHATGNEGAQAFFNYKLRGHKRLEQVPAEKLPAEILFLVRTNPNYGDDDEFRRWYWRYAGRRRSEIVTEEIKIRYVEASETPQG